MEIYVDGIELETDLATTVSISLSVASLTDLTGCRTGYTKTIAVPMTPHNREMMGDCEQIHGRDLFNHTRRRARIEHGGALLLEGTLLLARCERRLGGGPGWYRFNIVGAAREWASVAAATPLSRTAIDYERTLSESLVAQSWEAEDEPVRFLPVQRDSGTVTNGSESLMPAARVLSFEDYHPFVQVRRLLESIFAGAGYTVESEFFASSRFASLYMSGNYPVRDSSALRARMDFRAGRFASATATADRFGRVYANPLTNLSTVGNFVDTADPSERQDGVAVEGVFDAGGCFQRDGERIVFLPAEPVNVGFEYCIRYLTDYRIASRTELKGFNILNLDEGVQRTYRIVNRFADRRGAPVGGREFTVVVFDHTPGDAYRLDCLADGVRTVVAEFSARTAQALFPRAATLADERLTVCSASGEYVAYSGDWALYDGYVTESGRTEVELTVRTAAERVTRSEPKYFDRMWLGGGESGMSLTLLQGCTLRPLFSAGPGLGSKVSFADVFAHSDSQLSLINAVGQLFNLRFYTDSVARKVHIAPRDDFYLSDRITDWSDRIDCSRPVRVEEPGGDMKRRIELRYRRGDSVVGAYNRSTGDDWGCWSAELLCQGAAEGETVSENGLFTPSISVDGVYPDAPAASFIRVESSEENLDFLPKIVRYDGMAALPAGQVWGYPAGGEGYPRLSFHDPQQGETLCFEDRDGVQGLHRYYDKSVQLYDFGRRVTLWLRLSPQDVEALQTPGSPTGGFRSLYRLVVEGEAGLYTLEEVRDYNPAAASTEVVFVKKL